MAFATTVSPEVQALTDIEWLKRRYPWAMRDALQTNVYDDIGSNSVVMVIHYLNDSTRTLRAFHYKDFLGLLNKLNDELRPKRGKPASFMHIRGES